jgi:hypothetical protein
MFAIEMRPARSPEDNHTGESYCPGCRSWYENHRWISQEGDQFADSWTTYKCYDSPTSTNSNAGYTEIIRRNQDDIYTNGTIYECPSCYVFLDELNDEEAEEYSGYAYLCGACGEGWNDQEGAQECCSDIPNVKPDPAVFARSRRED